MPFPAPHPATVVAIALAATCGPASAFTEVTQTQVMMSADNCQAALPAFDGNIRKRPLAMANEGTTGAFVTCAFKGLSLDARSQGNNLIGVAIGSTGSQASSVTCTLVNGIREPEYRTRSRSVTPGIANLIFWQSADFGYSAGGLDHAAISCNLAPGVSILYTLRSYVENIVD